MKKIFDFFMYICAYISICNISLRKSNQYYHVFTENIKFALINFMLGCASIQIMSIDNAGKFNFCRHKKFIEDIDYDIIEENGKIYRYHLMFITKEAAKYELESLKDHFKYVNDVINRINVKMNAYVIILLMIISVFATICTTLKCSINQLICNYSDYKITIVIMCFFLYYLANACISAFQFYNQRIIYRQKFYDFKDARNKYREINMQYYMNWQYLIPNKENDVKICNLMREIMLILLILFVLICISLFIT